MEFLTKNTQGLLELKTLLLLKLLQGKDAVVIGGGDTGTDCVGTSIRHGCKAFLNWRLCLVLPMKGLRTILGPNGRKYTKWIMGRKRLMNSLVQILVIISQLLRSLLETDGNLKSLLIHEIEWKQENGRFSPVEVAGSEREIPAQVAFLAMGFLGPEDLIAEELGLERDSRSNIQAEYGKFATNIDGVFSAGDMRRGQSLVVWAINEGRAVARECDQFLMGETSLP